MRYSGKLGIFQSYEKSPGIFEESIVEKTCYGEVINNTINNNQSSEQLISDITVTNSLSIVINQYILHNHRNIKYVTWYGEKYIVSNIKIVPPRMIISIGDVYRE